MGDPILRTSEEWVKELGVSIMDPDGWDRGNFEASWNERITRKEFARRVRGSTIRMNWASRELIRVELMDGFCDNPECPQAGNCGGECARNF